MFREIVPAFSVIVLSLLVAAPVFALPGKPDFGTARSTGSMS